MTTSEIPPFTYPQILNVIPYEDKILQIFCASKSGDLLEVRFRRGEWKLSNIRYFVQLIFKMRQQKIF